MAEKSHMTLHDLKVVSSGLSRMYERHMEHKVDALTFHNTLLQNQVKEPLEYSIPHDDFLELKSKELRVDIDKALYEDEEKRFIGFAADFHPRRRYIALSDKDDVSLIARLAKTKPGVEFLVGSAKMRIKYMSLVSLEFRDRFNLTGTQYNLLDQLCVLSWDDDDKTFKIKEASEEQRKQSFFRVPRKSRQQHPTV